VARKDLLCPPGRTAGALELMAGVQENIRFANEIDAARHKGEQPYLVEAHIGAHAPFTVSNEDR